MKTGKSNVFNVYCLKLLCFYSQKLQYNSAKKIIRNRFFCSDKNLETEKISLRIKMNFIIFAE